MFFKSNYEKNKEILNKFIKSCTAVNPDTKDTTYATYENSMNLLFKWLKDNGNYYILGKKMLHNCSDILERYMIYCRDVRGNSNVTLYKKISTLSSFYIWAVRKKYIKVHPMTYVVERPKTQNYGKRESYFLTIEQIKTIYRELDTSPKFDIYDKVIFSLLFDTGMRRSALHSLKLSQLDMENNVFFKVREKGGKRIDYYFYEKTKEYITQLLEFRKNIGIKSEYLLISKYNGYNHMNKQTILSRVRKVGRIVGINKFYTHSVRKTAINLVSRTGGLELASEFANHANTKVTKDHYIKPKTFLEKNIEIQKIRQAMCLN